MSPKGRAQAQPDEAGPDPRGAPNDERGFAASTDLERAGGSGGREVPLAGGVGGTECPPVEIIRLLSLATVLALAPLAAGAVEVRSPDGELFAFPSLADAEGKGLATSSFEQWVEKGRLHVRITHAFHDGRKAVERARFTRGKELVQERWSWDERKGDEVVRAFDVDLLTGRATARKRDEGGKEKRWEESVKVLPHGRTFAGVGVTYAVKNLRDRLAAGETVTLRAVGFRPKPISLPIRIRHARRETIEVAGGHEVDADLFEVRPDLKGLEKVLELVKDTPGADVWLHHGRPPMILRIRYPLAEPLDPAVVLDTLGRR